MVAVLLVTAIVLMVGGYWPFGRGTDSAGTDPSAIQQPKLPAKAVAPYLYLGWADPPDPVHVMKATGVTRFTLAFLLSDGTCAPRWDGNRPLLGGFDQREIERIRAAHGDVVPSFGGLSGNKLGEACPDAQSLAAAYEQVIDAYRPPAIDIDLEGVEFQSAAVRQRIVDALGIVKRDRPKVEVYLTFSAADGTEATESAIDSLVTAAAAARLDIDAWVQMPFDIHGGTQLVDASMRAAQWLVPRLSAAYGYGSDVGYQHAGISTMNGTTDVDGELLSTDDMRALVRYARQQRLARFTFWSINRDRPCANDTRSDSCSGVPGQREWEYTRIVVRQG